MDKELVIVLDFGGQYNQLIARRVRECNVYAEVHPYTLSLDKIREMNPKGIIFTGGPNSVYLEDSPSYSKEIFELGIPILGICYGSQLMAHLLGGKVATAPVSEYGRTETYIDGASEESDKRSGSLLFKGIKKKITTWMSHTDHISEMPEGFISCAHTDNCPVAAMENAEKKLYGMQYHPEVMHTENGIKMLIVVLQQLQYIRGIIRRRLIDDDDFIARFILLGEERRQLGLQFLPLVVYGQYDRKCLIHNYISSLI